MQFKVPQDVQQADRIVSFLTLQQLIICVVGGGFAYAVYMILQKQGLPALFWIPPVGIMLIITAAFAFLKIANLPFHRYLVLLLERLIMPSRRVWIKGADRVISEEDYISPDELKKKEKEEKENIMLEEKEAQLKDIGSLMDVLETEKAEKVETNDAPEKDAELKEIEETPDEKLLQKAFLEKPAPSSTPPGPSAPLPQAPLAGKSKRKRKRKRKNLGVITGQVQPFVTPAPTPSPSLAPPTVRPATPATTVTPKTSVAAPAPKSPTVRATPVTPKPVPAPTPTPTPAVAQAPSPPEAPTPAITPQPEAPVSNAPVAPELELTEAASKAIEPVLQQPLVAQEKEELMIPEEPVLPQVAEAPKSQSTSLQSQGEFTADQLRAGATLQIPNS